MCFSPYLGTGRREGSPKGLVQNLLLQFFILGISKIEVLETTSKFHSVVRKT